MTITFYRHPVLFLEAEELVFAYVNGTPAQKLGCGDAYSLSTATVETLMAEACAGLDATDPTVQFFFQRHALPNCAPGASTCLGRLLAFSFADRSCSDVDEAIRALPGAWSWEAMFQYRMVFTEITPYGIGLEPWNSDEPLPFTNGLTQLQAPKKLHSALVKVFSDFQASAAALGELLRPVMIYLSRVLPSFVERAEPQIRTWEAKLNTCTDAEAIRELMHINVQMPVHSISAALLFLIPNQAIVRIDDWQARDIRVLLGAGGMPPSAENTGLGDWAYQALRLLGSPTRMNMLRALRRRPMTAQELTKALNLPHLSAVMRDLSSMQVYHLLDLKFVDNRRQYSVNCRTLELLISQLRELCAETEN